MNKKGFTLVEIIAVVTILGLLAIITTPAYDTISTNIKEKNYNSKMSTIKSQTLSYVEKYFKDIVYPGNDTERHCFTIDYLIQNGIISSDSEEEEYIENNITGEKYKGNAKYIQITYDNEDVIDSDIFKLEAKVIADEISPDCDKTDNK